MTIPFAFNLIESIRCYVLLLLIFACLDFVFVCGFQLSRFCLTCQLMCKLPLCGISNVCLCIC